MILKSLLFLSYSSFFLSCAYSIFNVNLKWLNVNLTCQIRRRAQQGAFQHQSGAHLWFFLWNSCVVCIFYAALWAKNEGIFATSKPIYRQSFSFKIKLNKCAWCDNENCGGGFIHCICDWLTAECCVAGSPGLTWIALAADTRTQHFIRKSFLVLDYTSFCLQICCKSLWQIQWGTGNSPQGFWSILTWCCRFVSCTSHR